MDFERILAKFLEGFDLTMIRASKGMSIDGWMDTWMDMWQGIHPPAKDMLEKEFKEDPTKMVTHKVIERTQVDVVRI